MASEEHLNRKIDNLTNTVNRLSKAFDDYVTTQQQPGGKPYAIKPGPGGAYKTPHPIAVQGQQDVEEDDFTQDFTHDENVARGNWSGRLDFLLASLGYAVGLGNVWRFPYLCYKNGGAVFFIPYCIMLVFVGIPIFFLEVSLGQFTSNGPSTCWEMAKFFKGIGVGMAIVSCLVAIYYNMIIAWALFYLFASFTSDLPWQHCDREWNTDFCMLKLNNSVTHPDNCTVFPDIRAYNNGTCYNLTTGKPWAVWGEKTKDTWPNFTANSRLPSDEYLNRRVIRSDLTAGIEDTGPVHWDLALCLLLAWIIVFLCIVKGIKSSGKVVYVTAVFPYVVLLILFIKGLTIPGHYQGIEFYILKPNITKLQEAAVWKDAAVQIFFSLSASWGGLIAYSSYNRFHNDCVRDSLIVSIGNCLTSFFAGFVIFSFLGFLAQAQNKGVEDVAEDGVGLAFIVYPFAVTMLPPSTFWAIIFFLMLITLGLDSEFCLVETVATCLFDEYPKLRKHKWKTVGLLAICMYLLGLLLCTNAGSHWLQLMDTYSGGWNVLVIALLECIAVAWVYGFPRFREDIRCMVGKSACGCFPWGPTSYWWGACWYLLTPAGVLFILIFSWIDYSPATYGDYYTFPVWANALGWLMLLFVLVGVFFTALVEICIAPGGCYEKMKAVFTPTRYWGPALPKHRKLCLRYAPEMEVDPWNETISMSNIKPDVTHDNYAYQ